MLIKGCRTCSVRLSLKYWSLVVVGVPKILGAVVSKLLLLRPALADTCGNNPARAWGKRSRPESAAAREARMVASCSKAA